MKPGHRFDLTKKEPVEITPKALSLSDIFCANLLRKLRNKRNINDRGKKNLTSKLKNVS
jgi:hypothetical protein